MHFYEDAFNVDDISRRPRSTDFERESRRRTVNAAWTAGPDL